MSSRKGKASVTPVAAKAQFSSSDESSGSPQRKSSRISSRGLLKQATMANFLKNPARESPLRLFKGLSKKPLENSLTVVQNDETMVLTPLPAPTLQQSILEKSRAKRKSIHEESFLHPSQKALVQSPVAKKKSSSSSVASSVFSAEDLRGDAVRNFLKHPKTGRFIAKRKTKESIKAEMFGNRIPVVALVPFDRVPAAASVVEEEPELEFTVNSSELDQIEIAGSQTSVVSNKTKVYESLPGHRVETDLDASASTHDPGTSRLQSRRRTNQMLETESESLPSGKRMTNSPYRRSGPSATDGGGSRSYAVNALPREESATTSANSSTRVSKRLSSARPSVGASLEKASEVEAVSSRGKKRLSASSGASEVSRMSRRRLELSQEQSISSPRRLSRRSQPSGQPVTEAGEAADNATEPEPALLLAANSSVEEEEMEETSRVNSLGSSTPRLPFTPKLPPKKSTPKSDWRNRPRAVVDARAGDRPGVAAKGVGGKATGVRPRAVVKPSIPRSLTHSVFKFFADTKVSKEALEEVEQVAEEFWDNVMEDLKVYAAHGGRNTIEKSDVELLLRRQRFVSDKISLNSLIEKYMVLEDREKLVLVARSGNRLV